MMKLQQYVFAAVLCLIVLASSIRVQAFQTTTPTTTAFVGRSLNVQTEPNVLASKTGDADDEIVAKRIIVKGDVQGGYYRSCVKNEAGRFRKLVGTMSPPDDTDKAEIIVEGTANMVDGFIRWCKRGKIGLSQVVGVEEVTDEEVTGLYDAFYVKTK